MAPTKGRIVHVIFRDGTRYNGSDTHPAIVTAVHGPGVAPLINARVFTDSDGAPPWLTSIPHADFVDAGYGGPVWAWPPRE